MDESTRPVRVVVDTNVLVSAALSVHHDRLTSTTARLFSLLATREVVAVASTQTLYELADKLREPQFELPPALILDFLDIFTNAADIVSIRGLDMGCKDDPDDNAFVETAVNGRVDYLITYDRGFERSEVLHELAKRNCKVLNAGRFLGSLVPSSTKD